ncbi:ShlB/FhaC/HecB family hemolysin secretion/activation protein [Novosphingobium sp. PhB165]|uniref:ShlB/FhaC/HecB family hemolysin secretion/activation protein n=1 Tax=Novosphingobium sp. PhB165 TaxID=2485105 RepID=UPI0014053BF7|nr:ShlB/FhaC/HecB family hemolysin secretion/activation protein [Novosphingobium sp. PhB165]
MKSMKVVTALVAAGAATFGTGLGMGLAHAQDFERRMPKQPPNQPAPEVPTPPAPAASADDATQILPVLRGLVFVNGPAGLQPAGIAADGASSGVEVRGLPLLANPAFDAAMRPYLNRPLTRGDLNAIVRVVQDAYRTGDHPFVDVGVPPQNVQSGVVQVVVTEYRVGAIDVTGNRHFSSNLIRGMSDLRTGEVLTLPRLREALDDYNQNPFLTVDGVVRPGQETGTTDLVLEAHDRLPVRVYAGYDNQGVPTLGRDEWFVGFNWGNVLGTGQILSYQFTRSFKGEYTSHSASDVIPITPDDRLMIFGAYAIQKPEFSDLFNSEGHSGQVSARFVHNMRGPGTVRTSIQVGIDYKRANSNLEFLGFRLLDSAVEVFQVPVIFTGTINDRHGQTVLENQTVISPGNVTSHNTDADLQQLVPYGKATYAYDRISITRTTYLPHGINWVVRGMAQFATSNLPYSEQLSAGGLGSVRGYDPNAALGSQGFLAKTELNSPAFHLLAKSGQFEDQMQLGVFVDYGKVWQQRRLPDSPKNAELVSVGAKAHYTVGRYLDLELDLGQQLKKAPFADSKETRLAMVATIGF